VFHTAATTKELEMELYDHIDASLIVIIPSHHPSFDHASMACPILQPSVDTLKEAHGRTLALLLSGINMFIFALLHKNPKYSEIKLVAVLQGFLHHPQSVPCQNAPSNVLALFLLLSL